MKVEVAILVFPSLVVHTVSVDVKHRWSRTSSVFQSSGAVWKLRGPSWAFRPKYCNSPYGLCGRKATLNLKCIGAYITTTCLERCGYCLQVKLNESTQRKKCSLRLHRQWILGISFDLEEQRWPVESFIVFAFSALSLRLTCREGS